MILVIPRLGALGGAAAAPLVGPLGADTGVAGALLAEQLFGAASNFATPQRGVGAGPAIGQVHQHDLVKKLLVNRAAEVGGVDPKGAHGLALSVEDAQAQGDRFF